MLLGASESRSFTITNTGGIAVEITKSKPPIGGAFAATTSLSEGTTIAPGESVTETVEFTPTSMGPASDAWPINGKDTTGLHEVKFSGEGVVPHAPSTESGATATAGLVTPLGGISPFTASREPPPSVTKLQIRAKASQRNQHPHELLLTYALSAAGSVKLAIYRRTVSDHCRRGVRTCDRWTLTKVDLKVAARAGANSLALSLAGLSPGDYRLAATPIARSGAVGATQYLRFDTAG